MDTFEEYEEETFLRLRDAVSRNAGQRHVKMIGLKAGHPGFDEALAEWRRRPWLIDPVLQQTARRVLPGARGPQWSEDSLFPSMLWYGGARDSQDGHRFKGTAADFLKHVLYARSLEVVEKGKGWVVTPTSNLNGWRGNASTTAMHALNLDADGTGDWAKMLAALEQLGFAHIAYQSGGWTPANPKWHILIPLSAPFDTTTPTKIDQWKTFYNHARTLFGTLAELVGEGFDPRVEAPSVPVFITERRNPADPPRQIVARLGATLDAIGLLAQLPTPKDEFADEPTYGIVPVDAKPLADHQLDRVVTALVKPMSGILSGRRDLYLALPGALLDRGLTPDDVLVIIDECSRRCPGDPSYTATEIAERHREHLHCAQTTINKYETGDAYTRIGTLATNWPPVAFAIDDVLPDPKLKGIRDLIERIALRGGALLARGPEPSPPDSPKRAAELLPPVPSMMAPSVNLADLRKKLTSLKKTKLKHTNIYQRIRGYIIASLLKGEDLVPFIELPEGGKLLLEDVNGKKIDCDESIRIAMGLIAFKVAPGTPFEAVAEVARAALFETAKAHSRAVEDLTNRAENAYLRSFGVRVETERVKADLRVQDRLNR